MPKSPNQENPSGGCRIKAVGVHEKLGATLYSWRYRNDDPTRYVGVMAQDLLVRPDLRHAVVVADEGEFAGFYSVKYSELGLRMTTEIEWIRLGVIAITHKDAA